MSTGSGSDNMESSETILNSSDNSRDREVSFTPRQINKLAALVKRQDGWSILRLVDRICLEIEEEISKADVDEIEGVLEAMKGCQVVYTDNLLQEAEQTPHFQFEKYREHLPAWIACDVVHRLESLGISKQQKAEKTSAPLQAQPMRYKFSIASWSGEASSWPGFFLEFQTASASMRLDAVQKLNFLQSNLPQQAKDLIPAGSTYDEAVEILLEGLDDNGAIVAAQRRKIQQMACQSRAEVLQYFSYVQNINRESEKLNLRPLLRQAGEVDAVLRKLPRAEADLAATAVVSARRSGEDDVEALLDHIRERLPILRLLSVDEAGEANTASGGGGGASRSSGSSSGRWRERGSSSGTSPGASGRSGASKPKTRSVFKLNESSTDEKKTTSPRDCIYHPQDSTHYTSRCI